jgi:branched-subunit amino acid ABC-type transport system permease component
MPSIEDVLQLTANGAVNGSAYALLGVGFALIYGTTGRFHFAYGLTYAVAAYAAAQIGQKLGLPFALAIAVGALASLVLGVLIERLVYRPLAARSGADSLLTVFVASLGVAIVGENLIRLIWIDEPNQQIAGVPLEPVEIGSVNLTVLNLELIAVCWLLIAALTVLLARTRAGRNVRAVRVNPEMSLALGIDPGRIYLLVFAVGSALAGVAGVFAAAQTAVTPAMGFTPTLFAFAIAFLGGPTRSPLIVGLAGLAVGLIQSWSGLWLSAQWSTPIVFGLIVVYAASRPLQARFQVRRAARAVA